MVRLLSLFCLALFVASCAPSADPAMQSKINSYFGKSSSRSFKGGAFVPMPLAVGQYTVYGTTMDGKRSIMKQAIVGQEQGGWIIETHSITESNESISQMLVTGLDKAREKYDPDAIDIVWVKTREGSGEVQSVDGPVLSITKGLYRKALVNFTTKTSGLTDAGSITVPAGTFAGTQKLDSEVTFLMSTYKSQGWISRDVPIGGTVKSVMPEDNITMELLDFGTSGAVRSF